MWIAVVPALNEEASISRVMETLAKTPVGQIILVANGCTDKTLETAQDAAGKSDLKIIEFAHPLGLDIPRAVGAFYAKKKAPQGIIFVDGDMKGDIAYALSALIKAVENGADMALTNCYPYILLRSSLTLSVLRERETLNRHLGIFDELGLASPSHGPHAISGRLLQALPPETIAIPPLSLAYAVKENFTVKVGASIAHTSLGSRFRNNKHAALIAETIIGDTRQALYWPDAQNLPGDIPDGYRSMRRFDLLQKFVQEN
ncbi:MAG: glycosyltransferase [Clostridia bacterium]|jgi:glycosyltransferase involved in cell wall biosynthesis|nr:glycosyltransferase [Clostridia bacterium]